MSRGRRTGLPMLSRMIHILVTLRTTVYGFDEIRGLYALNASFRDIYADCIEENAYKLDFLPEVRRSRVVNVNILTPFRGDHIPLIVILPIDAVKSGDVVDTIVDVDTRTSAKGGTYKIFKSRWRGKIVEEDTWVHKAYSQQLDPEFHAEYIARENSWERSRVTLSIKQLEGDPLLETLYNAIPQDGTLGMDSSTIPEHLNITPLPELDNICIELLKEDGITEVRIGREGFEKRVVSQDLQLWLSNHARAADNQFTILARAGRQVQEVHLTTTLDHDGIKKALQRVLERVP
ncbi:hypothetical protein GIB67_028832 [Kingdonia uniflora]|uniref:Uncharacterized protein n=1 Tax=Kingdonia uniflora TaxID=39325 RepID=A0A7J7LTD7_9MAGN|nr:hypothetical protein GIB67_028832 [Kingdonia uniflora]